MAKSNPRMRLAAAAPDDNFPELRVAPRTEAFPPLTISLETFVKNGSDRTFRRLIFELMGLQNQMQRHSDQFARYIGTTNAQFQVLMVMAQMPDLTVSQLAQMMNVTSQFITIEIGGLIRKGIVEKRPNESDRRSSFLNLSLKGRNLVCELAPVMRRATNLHFRSLTEEGTKLLTETIHAIVEDGRRVIHELESPDIRDAMAPSARMESDARDFAPRPASKRVRRS